MGNQTQGKQSDLDPMKKYSQLTVKHVMLLKDRLDLLAEPDLTITMDSFQTALKASDDEAKRVFQIFDLSSSGKIETLEFICALSLLSHSSLREKCDLLFGLYDFDNNMTMTIQELIILIKTVLTTINAISGRGECTIAEAQDIANKILARYDTNGDASISKPEFYSFASKDPDILSMLISYGLLSLQDLRFNFGGNQIPEPDSDLENEIHRSDDVRSIEEERIALDIVEETDVDHRGRLKWMGKIKKELKYSIEDSNPPNANLEIDHIYGFRCFDTRNNVKLYQQQGQQQFSIVYHQGAVGIQMFKQKQQFFMEHTDDITCLDVRNELACTGQLGQRPTIFVWDLITMEVKVVFKGVLSVGISNIAFSNDGSKLVAIGMDKEQCIVLYDIEKAISARLNGKRDESLIANSKGPETEIFDVKFDKSDKQIIIACMGELNFVTYDNNLLKIIKGVWEYTPEQPLQAVLALGLLENTVAAGTFKGLLMLWRGTRTTKTQQAHNGPIQSIYTRMKDIGVITGGKDGIISVWDTNLVKLNSFNINEISIKSQVILQSYKITSIDASNDESIMIVGTRGGQILELHEKLPFQYSVYQVLVQGHFNGNLDAVCCHPKLDLFYTAGQDQMIFIWDLKQKKAIASQKLDFCCICLDVSERFLIVGCSNGNILVFDPEKLTPKQDAFKDRDSEISVLKIIPEVDLLVVFYTEPYREFFFYKMSGGFRKVKNLLGKIGKCTSIDYCHSPKYLQLAFDTQDIYYLDLDFSEQVKITSDFKDYDWRTWTCTYGWAVKGIWPFNTRGNEIFSVDRSKTSPILITSDKFAGIKLYKYPAICDNQSYSRYSGHSNQVSKVRFSAEDRYVVSLGGFEKSVIQWKFTVEQQVDTTISQQEQQNRLKTLTDDDDVKQMMIGLNSDKKPYLDTIKYLDPPEIVEPPQYYLNLKFVIGCKTLYQEQPVYNILKYTQGSKVVYPNGNIIVVQDTKSETDVSKKQQYYFGHTEEIISLAVHPKSTNIIATGTCKSEINIWDVETKMTLVQINDFHKHGICKLRFSLDGTQLLTVGQDSDNSLAVYDWVANRLLSTSKIDRQPIVDICYKTNSSFVTCGSFLRLWFQAGRNLSFDQLGPKQTSVTLAFNQELISGDENGEITMWKDKKPIKKLGHVGKVTVLVGLKTQLYSAGQDGRILVWTLQSNQLQQNNILQTDVYYPIYSLDARSENLVYINSQCDIVDVFITSSRTNPIIKGHGIEISGLALSLQAINNNMQRIFIVTCGMDRLVKIWDYQSKSQHKESELFKNGLKAIDWSNNGLFIAVGDVKSQIFLLNDQLNIINFTTTKFKSQKLSQPISEIRFNPDSNKLAVGGTWGPSHLEIYSITKTKSLDITNFLVINTGFTSGMSKLDWSVDSLYVLATSETYELKCINIQRMKDQLLSNELKWSTLTCQYGPIVQEIYPYKQGEDVTSVFTNFDKKFIITGDKYGTVSLFNCPALTPLSRKYPVHSGPVVNVKASPIITRLSNSEKAREYLVAFSIGNQGLMIWDIDQDINKPTEIDQDKLIQQLGMPQQSVKKVGYEKYGKIKQEELQFSDENQDPQDILLQNTIFMKPWMSNIKEPSQYYKDPINQNTPPLINLVIDHAFGYRGNDCKNNIRYLKNGSILYHTASLGIVYDSNINHQKIYNLHTDDIISIDLHPDGIRVATGEVNTGIIYVWDSNTLQTLCKFAQLTTGVISLSFSPKGEKLVAVSMDEFNEIGVFDITTKNDIGGQLIYKFQTSKQKIFEARMISEVQFITIGPCHLKVWTLENRIISDNFSTNQVFVTSTYLDDDEFYVTDLELRLIQYKFAYDVRRKIKVQESKQYPLPGGEKLPSIIEALNLTKEMIIMGFKDSTIQIIDRKTFELIYHLKISDILRGTFMPIIKSVCLGQENKIIVGTFGCEIIELMTKDTKITPTTKFIAKSLMKGHYAPNLKSELWGLAIDGDFAYTCGDDATLRQWSLSQKKQVNFVKTNQDNNYNEIKPDESGQLLDMVKGRSIAIAPEYIVVGFKDGSIRLYDRDLKQKVLMKIGKDWISDIKISPKNDIIAFASHDNCIYVYTFPELVQSVKPLRKHSDFIKNIDFSQDGNKLISTCGGYDLIYWDVKTGKQLPNGRIQLRDEFWSQWTNILGWPVQGIWQETFVGLEINCVARSNNQFSARSPDNYYLLAVGNDYNEILLYRYPCVNRNSLPLKRRGHSSPLAQVKFSQDDKYLVSLGGEDMTLIVWKVVRVQV